MSIGNFQFAQDQVLLDKSNMGGLKEFVEKRLEELGENAITLARSNGVERGFINDILIDKKQSVRGDKMQLLADLLKTTVEEISKAQNRKSNAPQLLTEPNLHRVESSVDRDLGRKQKADTIFEIDVRAGAGGGGQRTEKWIRDGAGNSYAAEGIRDEWRLPATIMREELRAAPAHIRVFEVIGDSMQPILHEGDRAFIDTRYTQPVPDGVFALWDGYGLVIKMLQVVRGSEPIKVKIISKNDSYPTYEATIDEIKIVGRLSGKFTTSF